MIVCCLTAPLASLPPISSPISQEESGEVHSVALNLPFYQTLLLLLLLHLKLLLLLLLILLLLIHIPPLPNGPSLPISHEQIEVANKEVEELLHSNNLFPLPTEQTTHPPFSNLEKCFEFGIELRFGLVFYGMSFMWDVRVVWDGVSCVVWDGLCVSELYRHLPLLSESPHINLSNTFCCRRPRNLSSQQHRRKRR